MEARIPTTITTVGKSVLSKTMDSPEMILVAAPVSENYAILLTGSVPCGGVVFRDNNHKHHENDAYEIKNIIP